MITITVITLSNVSVVPESTNILNEKLDNEDITELTNFVKEWNNTWETDSENPFKTLHSGDDGFDEILGKLFEKSVNNQVNQIIVSLNQDGTSTLESDSKWLATIQVQLNTNTSFAQFENLTGATFSSTKTNGIYDTLTIGNLETGIQVTKPATTTEYTSKLLKEIGDSVTKNNVNVPETTNLETNSSWYNKVIQKLGFSQSYIQSAKIEFQQNESTSTNVDATFTFKLKPEYGLTQKVANQDTSASFEVESDNLKAEIVGDIHNGQTVTITGVTLENSKVISGTNKFVGENIDANTIQSVISLFTSVNENTFISSGKKEISLDKSNNSTEFNEVISTLASNGFNDASQETIKSINASFDIEINVDITLNNGVYFVNNGSISLTKDETANYNPNGSSLEINGISNDKFIVTKEWNNLSQVVNLIQDNTQNQNFVASKNIDFKSKYEEQLATALGIPTQNIKSAVLNLKENNQSKFVVTTEDYWLDNKSTDSLEDTASTYTITNHNTITINNVTLGSSSIVNPQNTNLIDNPVSSNIQKLQDC